MPAPFFSVRFLLAGCMLAALAAGCGIPVVGGVPDVPPIDSTLDEGIDATPDVAPDVAPVMDVTLDMTAPDVIARCRDNSECVNDPAGPVCDRMTGLCGRCGSSADCMGHPGGATCVMATGRCGPCASMADCVDSPAGPVCDPMNGRCGRCTGNADCAMNTARPLCNTMTGQCFRCMSNADCMGNPAGNLCNTLSGACVRCSSNVDCGGNPAGPTCLMAGGCGRCTEDSDCMGNAGGPLCNRTTGVCTRCTSNADCMGNPSGPQCVLLSGVCSRCMSNNDCATNPAAPLCNAMTGACFRCTADADCAGNPAGEVCNTAAGVCVRCVATTDTCPAAQRCDPRTNTCVDGCRNDEGCASTAMTPRCDTRTNTCVACVTDAQCPLGTACRGNTCVAGCDAMRPCPGGQTCCAGGCVNTTNNTGNCGRCGNTCAVASATAVCTAGVCGVGTCNTNFADCNRMAADGCETFTGGEITNCGRCGNTCPVPSNATAVCRAGVCGVGPCAGGFSDCNMMSADGCEVNLQADARNCGACGRACPAPANAVPTCSMSRCGYTCLAGFADCDGDATNGCEANVQSNVLNCGTCGTVCRAGSNATPSCVGGMCQPVCNRGFADCTAADGCETSTLTNASNCGGCGRACPSGQECANGSCAAPCPGGQTRCGATCVVLSNDPSNCGACGTTCSSTQLCGGGRCIPSCLSPQTVCGRTCASLQTDPFNCGSCGTACRAGFSCMAGRCVPVCVDSSFTACSDVCVNLRTDEDNCGLCGRTCRADQACREGTCVTICAGRLTLCGDGECYDLANDPNNCGACGRTCTTGCYMGSCSGIAELESLSNNNCGLYTSGRVFCWGHSNGMLTTSAGGLVHRVSPVQVTDSIGRPLENVRQIATGNAQACALIRNGTVRCWGSSGVLGDVSSLASINQIAARGGNFCALRMDGRVLCWNGLPRDTMQPALVPVVGVTTAVEVTAGGSHACARLADNSVVCWGSGGSGQLGDGRSVTSATPVVVTGLTDATALTSGTSHSCALRMGGGVVCWGLNTNGQVGNGTIVNAPTPVAVTGLAGVRQVRAGLRHTCAVLTAGGVRCWGENLWSQLGDGTAIDRSTPVAVAGLASSRWVSAYDHHSCAITSDNRVFCWGYNPLGEAGGGTESRPTPARVMGLSNVVDLQSGSASNATTGAGTTWRCALSCASGVVGRRCTGGGTVRCWGSRVAGNEYGQLADGTTTHRPLPAPAMTLTDVRQLSILSLHGCVVRTNGTVACWGYNANGQLGDGTRVNRSVPVTVPGLSNVVEVEVGSNHTCAIIASGTERQVWCWGYNFHGELGVGNMIDTVSPVRVPGVVDAADLRVMSNASCIRRTAGALAGQVWCWGRNIESQLADGSNTNRFSPSAVTSPASTSSMAVPQTMMTTLNCLYSGCWARRSDSTFVSWGQQIGGNRASPTTFFNNVADYNNNSNSTSCIIRTDNTTVCNGYNEFGNNGTGLLSYYDGTLRPVAGDFVALDVPLAYGNPCAIERAGTVACWGWTGNGALLAAGIDGVTRTPAEISPP